MENLHFFLYNYYTLACLSGAFVTGLIALFLYKIQNKSIATKYLAIVSGTAFLVTSGYVVIQGFYFPIKTPRFLLLALIAFNHAFIAQIFFHFPDTRRPKVAKGFLIGELIWATAILVLLAVGSLKSGLSYDFSGHYYEIQMPVVLRIYGASILIHILIVTGVAIWRLIVVPKQDRLIMILMLVAFLLYLVVPSVVNVMNKSGLVTRETYITVFCLSTIVGFFLLVVTYINRTDDKTSFMFKVVGASLVSFFICYNYITFTSIKDRELAYDTLRKNETRLAAGTKYKSEGLEYMLEYEVATAKVSKTYTKLEEYGSFADSDFQYNLINSYYYAQIQSRSGSPELGQELDNLSILNKKYLKGYRGLLDIPSPLPDNEKIDKESSALFYKYNKISQIEDKDFRSRLIEMLSKEKGNFLPFAKAMREHLESSTAEGKDLKKEILLYLLPLQSGDVRVYRTDSYNRHYVAYHFVDLENGKVYECGYSYYSYREFIDVTGKKMFLILCFALILFTLGIPFFLYGTLIKPLNALLDGVKKVRGGNLNETLPVKVHDEIGYLSSSFNGMVQSIRESKMKLEDYADHLEEKVEERTRELQISLNRVEELKSQQDGDYFLTTLLLKPLSGSSVHNSRIKVDFFLKQKKEFKFKSKPHDIGGDICISHEIKLKGRKYVVFMNGDAMGKSMQGAGGILVLGAVFQSIIQRTIAYHVHSEVPPEQWMKGAFKEMHKIFESFDGSMLISLIFGLVEERSGLMYYINAEHPWLILYRDGIADFIEHDMTFRKLGTSGMSSEIFISTYQLMPGDLIIMGSDGKDDVVLSKDTKTDIRIINEDEKLFLKRVEESKGDLNHIFNTICGKYELMDDFSLLSINYMGVSEELDSDLQVEVETVIADAKDLITKGKYSEVANLLQPYYDQRKGRHQVAQYLIKSYMKLKIYDKASKIAKEFLDENEVDTDIMFKASYCLKMNHEFEEAIEMAERVKLREPKNIRNLVHLADMYAFTKNYPRAKKIVNKILVVEPNNKPAIKIKEALEDKVPI